MSRFSSSTLRLALAIVVAFLLALAAVGNHAAQAATFTVTKTADTADGTCDGDCSLREAIIAANAAGGPDDITLPAGTYTLSIAGAGEDAAATGDLDITDDLTLAGAGAATTTVDAAGLDRVFDVMGPITVEIRQITVTGGVTDPDTSRNGGGIQNSDATLTVEDVVITGNATGNFNGASGGGLVNVDSGVVTINSSTIDNNTAPNTNNTGAGVANTESGVMTINDSTISNNTALQDGGGVFNANVGFLTINNSVISGNQGRFGGGFSHGNGATAIINDSTITGNQAIDGGGVENDQGTTITINRTTIAGNTATGEGGGVFVSQGGIVAITNSTISGNSATFGGGIQHEGRETVTVTNSTISGNSATSNSGGINNTGDGTVTLTNTIVANNSVGGDCVGTITSSGNNLDSDGTCGLGAAGDISNTDPKLGALADNGGPTQTHALLSDSPAIDAADNAACPATDQRGVTRPQGPTCDIGAYEFEVEPTSTPTPTPTPTPAVAEAVQLPTTGGEPAGSSSLPWLLAIAGAIAVMSAGGVFVAVRRRR